MLGPWGATSPAERAALRSTCEGIAAFKDKRKPQWTGQ
jgi:hypothetical protein